MMQNATHEDDLTEQEIRDALEYAKQLTDRENAIVPKEHGLTFYSYEDRAPFDGVSVDHSDKIRAFLAARYGGFTAKEACQMVGSTYGFVTYSTKKYPHAWQQAHAEIREAVAREHFVNLGYIRTALSEYAPHALRTLYAIMNDRRNSAQVRRQCARDILKMANVDNSMTISTMADEFADQLSDNILSQLSDYNSTTIVEADYETEEDDDNES